MKRILIICFPAIMFMAGFTSCLESGLDDLETYSETEITAINFEYRWMVAENPSDPWAGDKLQVKTMTTDAAFSDGRVECAITVPAASGTFTAEERDKVTLQNLNAYVTISPGASIRPNGSSPVLGERGDFSQPDISYTVTAANGDTQEWVIVINSLIK